MAVPLKRQSAANSEHRIEWSELGIVDSANATAGQTLCYHNFHVRIVDLIQRVAREYGEERPRRTNGKMMLRSSIRVQTIERPCEY